LSAARRLAGSGAGLLAGLFWSPIVMFLVWLPRLNYPDGLAYGMAATAVLALGVLGFRHPTWGFRMVLVAVVSVVGLGLLLALQVLEVA
jgi:hypothetical protein